MVDPAVKIEITPLGETQLPADLVAPFGAGCPCGREEFWFAPIEDVVRAALCGEPLTSACCGRVFGVRDIAAVAFVSRHEWESTPDDHPPATFFVGSAFYVGVAK